MDSELELADSNADAAKVSVWVWALNQLCFKVCSCLSRFLDLNLSHIIL